MVSPIVLIVSYPSTVMMVSSTTLNILNSTADIASLMLITYVHLFQKHKAYQLEKYCYHFFLANLGLMMTRDEFRSLLGSNQVGQQYILNLFDRFKGGHETQNLLNLGWEIFNSR